MRSDVLLQNDKVIPAWVQPVVLLDLCHARGVPLPKLLHNTALFLGDLPFRGAQLSLSHYRQLLSNANRLWPGEDFPFQLGHQLANSGLGPLAELLSRCEWIDEQLNTLCRFAFLLNPALRLQVYRPTPQSAMVLCHASGQLYLSDTERLVAMTTLRQLLSQHPATGEISCYLSAPRRHAIEHYHSHLSADCHFQAPWDGLLLSLSISAAPETSSSLRFRVVEAECEQLVNGRRYLIDALHRYLHQHPDASDLPDAAAYLGTSISTLKRRLREHACTYQEVLDSARREQALVELLLNDASVDAISERLHFHDSSNFRRAFKRWTGTTPSLLKSAFQ